MQTVNKKYTEAWENATIAQTHTGDFGISHICTDDLLNEEENEKQKEHISEFIYDVLCQQETQSFNLK
jgi:hypothetical protein